MSPRYALGWLMVFAALLSAMAEVAARAVGGGTGWYMSAHDLWITLWPDGVSAARATVGRVPVLWDPVLLAILSLPAWLTLSVPGGLLVWRFHPQRGEDADFDEDSFFLFDSLARQARDEGLGDDPPRNDAPPPRFLDHASADDDRDEMLPGPFGSLDWPQDDDESPQPHRHPHRPRNDS